MLAPATGPADRLARLEEAAVGVGLVLAGAEEGIRGLASADFLVEEDGAFHLLEINARPGASLEAIEAAAGIPLVGLHVAAGPVPIARRPPPSRASRAHPLRPPVLRDAGVPGVARLGGRPHGTGRARPPWRTGGDGILACTDGAETPMLRLAERTRELWRRVGVGDGPSTTNDMIAAASPA